MAKEIQKEFKSIHEFLEYLEKTPTSQLFKNTSLSSKSTSSDTVVFTKTVSYGDAVDLMKNGWDEVAKKIEKKLNIDNKDLNNRTTNRAKYDIVGFQASVPRYLQGIPTNMVNRKNVVQKQKVITIVKHVGYLLDVDANTIIEHSTKALQIVKAIEDKGIRVNLDVISPAETFDGKEIAICRVRVKSADERLNVSKIAFPMVHPSMLRRLVFRFREVQSDLKESDWTFGYGRTIYDRERVKKYLHKNEYYLHNFIENIEEEIKLMNL